MSIISFGEMIVTPLVRGHVSTPNWSYFYILTWGYKGVPSGSVLILEQQISRHDILFRPAGSNQICEHMHLTVRQRDIYQSQNSPSEACSSPSNPLIEFAYDQVWIIKFELRKLLCGLLLEILIVILGAIYAQ